VSSSDAHDDVVPADAVAGLAAAVTRVHELEKQRRLISRVLFSQAHTLKGAQLLTLMYANQSLLHEEKSLIPA